MFERKKGESPHGHRLHWSQNARNKCLLAALFATNSPISASGNSISWYILSIFFVCVFVYARVVFATRPSVLSLVQCFSEITGFHCHLFWFYCRVLNPFLLFCQSSFIFYAVFNLFFNLVFNPFFIIYLVCNPLYGIFLSFFLSYA